MLMEIMKKIKRKIIKIIMIVLIINVNNIANAEVPNKSVIINNRGYNLKYLFNKNNKTKVQTEISNIGFNLSNVIANSYYQINNKWNKDLVSPLSVLYTDDKGIDSLYSSTNLQWSRFDSVRVLYNENQYTDYVIPKYVYSNSEYANLPTANDGTQTVKSGDYALYINLTGLSQSDKLTGFEINTDKTLNYLKIKSVYTNSLLINGIMGNMEGKNKIIYNSTQIPMRFKFIDVSNSFGSLSNIEDLKSINLTIVMDCDLNYSNGVNTNIKFILQF